MWIRLLPIVGATLLLGSCGKSPQSICDMPNSRHFWQGAEVVWSGDIFAISEGGGEAVFFSDIECGRKIDVRFAEFRAVYEGGNYSEGYLATAHFRVHGHIRYNDGQMVLEPVDMTRTSDWATFDNGEFHQRVLEYQEAPSPAEAEIN